MNHHTRSARPSRGAALPAALLVSLLVMACSAAAAPDPAPHRFQEAATKARLAAAAGRVEAEKTAGQDFYDVLHYDLDLTLAPATRILTGQVATTARIVGSPLSTLDLDLKSTMAVTAATVGGAATTWSRSGDVLTVDLDRTYVPGETVTVSVSYQGNPAGSYFGWSSAGGQTMIWTLSEPFGSRHWWPCKDLNTDKADSVDVRVTVPDGLIVASNGLLASETDNGATRTFLWRTRYPIVPYLVSLAIHPYTRFSHWYTPLAGGDPMEVQYFVYPSHYEAVQANYAKTVPMITAFAQAFGEYPFVQEKYGHAEFTWGGGMEHQTITSLGGYSEDLISHELAHQWWGDMITCADFHHIWLNEGFATWCEAYWKERTAGVATYRAYMADAAYLGPGTVYVEDTSDFWAIFDGNLSYNKGSWVVHMLRGVLGDEDFFAGLAAYRDQYAYGSVTTEQFRDVMEQVSGRDLDAFFQQWVYGEYYPFYSYDWETTTHGDGLVLNLAVTQAQAGVGPFAMPLPVRVTTAAGVVDTVVWNDAVAQSYRIAVPGAVTGVALDPDGWILCEKAAVPLMGTAAPEIPSAAAPRLTCAPNPFNPETEAVVATAAAGRVDLAVHDAAGRLVEVLCAADLPAGEHRFRWRGRDAAGRAVASGTYFLRLRTPSGAVLRPVALVR
jgi:aminopeptidase N